MKSRERTQIEQKPVVTMTLIDYYARKLHPAYVKVARHTLSDWAHFKVTTLVWFKGAYRALPK